MPEQLLKIPSFCLTSSFGKLDYQNAKRCHGAWPVNIWNGSKVQNAAQLLQMTMVQYSHGAASAALWCPVQRYWLLMQTKGPVLIPCSNLTTQIKAQAGCWGPPETGILCYLCWSCCIDLLPQASSPKLPVLAGSHPWGAQQPFRTTSAMEGRGRKIKDPAFSGGLSNSSEERNRRQRAAVCLAIPMQMDSLNKCLLGLLLGWHMCGRCNPTTG